MPSIQTYPTLKEYLVRAVRSAVSCESLESTADILPGYNALTKEPLIAYRRSLVRLVDDVIAGLMLSQALYWTLHTDPDSDGWFYKSRDEWYEETGIERRAQELARRILRSTAYWEESGRGLPSRLHFRINVISLLQAMTAISSSSDRSLLPENDGDITLPDGATLELPFSSESPYSRVDISNPTAPLSPGAMDRILEACKGILIRTEEGVRKRVMKAYPDLQSTRIDYAAIYRNQNGICPCCGKVILKPIGITAGDLRFDYVIRLSDGGEYAPENVYAGHSKCVLIRRTTGKNSDLFEPFLLSWSRSRPTSRYNVEPRESVPTSWSRPRPTCLSSSSPTFKGTETTTEITTEIDYSVVGSDAPGSDENETESYVGIPEPTPTRKRAASKKQPISSADLRPVKTGEVVQLYFVLYAERYGSSPVSINRDAFSGGIIRLVKSEGVPAVAARIRDYFDPEHRNAARYEGKVHNPMFFVAVYDELKQIANGQISPRTERASLPISRRIAAPPPDAIKTAELPAVDERTRRLRAAVRTAEPVDTPPQYQSFDDFETEEETYE